MTNTHAKAAMAASALLGLATIRAEAAAPRGHARVVAGHAHRHGHAARRHALGYVQGIKGRWYRYGGHLPSPRHGLAPAYAPAPRAEDVDYGHLSTQATAGGPYRSEVPLPYLRAEPPLAPSPYLGR